MWARVLLVALLLCGCDTRYYIFSVGEAKYFTPYHKIPVVNLSSDEMTMDVLVEIDRQYDQTIACWWEHEEERWISPDFFVVFRDPDFSAMKYGCPLIKGDVKRGWYKFNVLTGEKYIETTIWGMQNCNVFRHEVSHFLCHEYLGLGADDKCHGLERCWI